MEQVIQARVSALFAAALASVALFAGATIACVRDAPAQWACDAEDMVVVIDDSCQHIDMLTHEDLRLFTQQGVKP